MGRLLFVTFVAFSLSGCAVILPGRSHPKHDDSSSKPGHCKPSQEWDGTHCRHKGQGSGSRKHDD
ncbi:MAG: hypothetical protein M3Y59_11195 [Myxococcota bacterium]|nr:hypothetical protein [Myxococcota bacterium]